MADHAHGRPVVTPPLNHELSDADPSPVLKFLAFLVVITAVIAGFVVFFYNFLERREAAEKTARYPMSLVGGARPLPPPPRLQNYPFQDVKQLRQNDKPLLDTYEWVDKSSGMVRIPVDRAMDLLAERGLPYRKPGQPSATPPKPPPGTQPSGAPAAGAPSSQSGASAASSRTQTPTGTSSGRQPTTASPPKPKP